MNIFFKNFINLTEPEIISVLNMRNSPSVREKMYNQEIITLEEHKKWLETLPTRNDCLYFLVFADNTPIGVVDFTSITNDSCEWGYYLSDKLQGSGYGILLENFIIQYAFKTLNISKLFCAVLNTNSNVYNQHINYFSFLPDITYSSIKYKTDKKLQFDGLSITKEIWNEWDNQFVKKCIHLFHVTNVEWDDKKFSHQPIQKNDINAAIGGGYNSLVILYYTINYNTTLWRNAA